MAGKQTLTGARQEGRKVIRLRTGCRLEVVGNEQDKTTGRQAQGKQVGIVCS
jgi:hypothetical protein